MNTKRLSVLHGGRDKKMLLKSICFLSVFHALIFLPAETEANERYQAKGLNGKATSFYGRYGADLVNIQYIKADIIGTVKKSIREGSDILQDLDEYIIPTASGSVFVLPGVNADELIIYNDGSGFPIAIKR
ncbi:hypothetical protein GCM10009123_10240 [Kangiella japonica]|uniref:Uncharacterized protein n=1 Tax=Kangiella japonica TaxID=647384 RepID=A0ABP3CII3_9GAMM